MPQNSGSSRFWQSIASKIRGRSKSRERASDVGTEEIEAEKKPQQLGLQQVNRNLPLDDKSSSRIYEVDIVAIHGLDGSAFGTWTVESSNEKTHKKTSTNWITDFLPRDVPGARIFTYGYESHLLFSKSRATVDDFAQKLLFALKVSRQDQEQRPIIFITHSLGGIVCKQALILANEDSNFSILLDKTIGILFFGTPHRGATGTPDVGIFLGNVFDTLSSASLARLAVGKTRTDLLETLKANSQDLRRITKSFSHISKMLQIVTIFETEELKPFARLVVDQDSAIMGISGEKTISRAASHTGICRFKDPTELDYRIVLMEIVDMYKKRFPVPSLDERQKYRVGLFNNFDINEYRSSLPARVNGTCEWVLNNQHYDRWVEEKQASLLWVTGPPGYGKTTLSSYVIDHLDCGKKSTKMDAIVCCFFCVDGIETTKDAKAILRGIIFQILVERPELIKHATRAFDYDTDGTKLFKSYDSLWSLFTEIICDDRLKLVTIVIDAVDECEKAGRNRLMESIARLIERLRHVTSRCVRFCITSRPYVTIMRCFKSYKPQHLMLEEEQTEIDGDLRRVIRERVRKTAEVAHAKQDTIDRWERSLIETADRTFLWTKFILDILDEELLTSPRDFDRILIGIPRDLKATYARFLQKVPPNKEGFAMKLLYVIIASTRPLSLHEINIVISLQEAASTGCRDLASLKKDHLHTNMESDINFVLGPLIRIEKSRVYLAHLSLKEFLCTLIGEYPDKGLSIRYKIDLGVANLFLASACMKYLALEDFSQDLYTVPAVGKGHSSPTSLQSSPIELASPQDVADAEEDSEDDCGMLGNLLQEPEELEAQTCLSLAQKYCLFEYSATNWARHFAQSQNLADDSLKSLALRLSDRTCQHQFENWFRFFWNNCMDQSSSSRKYDQLVIAAFFGHSTSLEAILADNNFDHVESLAIGLYWASRNGNNRSVVMLLTTDVDPNLETVNHQSPLSAAAESGHRDVVKTLLDDGGADINCGAEHDKTPLSMAVGNGHIGIVRLLLPYEHIRVDTEGSKGRTPLYSAISGCHMGIIGILTTDSRVNVNHLDAHDLIPFALAAEEGNEEIVALLLKTPSIDVDHASKDGRTPLCRAAQSGHSAVIKQLKRNGRLKIDHSHKDKTSRNAFGWAALGGHNEVIKLLLRYKLPGIDEEDQHKWTPLFWALEAPLSSTVETLIKSNEINVNHRDHSGRTALSWTVSYGNTTTLRILLDAPDIDPLVPDEQGLTSLDWAWKFEDRSHIADVLEQHVKEKASRSL